MKTDQKLTCAKREKETSALARRKTKTAHWRNAIFKRKVCLDVVFA